MTSLWINRDSMTIRKHSISGTATKSIVKIEIEVTDPHDLAFFLRELTEAQLKGAAARAEKAAAAKREEKERRGLGRQKILALPDLRGRS